jgi:hypothetical protein
MGIDKFRTPDFAPSFRLREATSGKPGGYVWHAGDDWEQAGSPGTVVEASRQQLIYRNATILAGAVLGGSLVLIPPPTLLSNCSPLSRAFPAFARAPGAPVRFL